MPSFEFAVSPICLQLKATPAGDAHERRLTCATKSLVERQILGRVAAEPQGNAKPNWFRIAGASSTGPREVELTFQPKVDALKLSTDGTVCQKTISDVSVTSEVDDWAHIDGLSVDRCGQQ
jgi:hypothetical protein